MMELEKSRPQRINLAEIEARMCAMEDRKIEIPVEHIFSAGVYVRQITIPAGSLVMGKRHRHATCNILLKGVLTVYTDEDMPPVTVSGPLIFTTEPCAKKFAYCHEEAVFLNVIPTDSTDPDEIEKAWIIPEDEYLMLKEGAKCLLSRSDSA